MGDILGSLNECGMLTCNVLQELDAFTMAFQR